MPLRRLQTAALCCCSGEADSAPGNHVHSPCALALTHACTGHAGCMHKCKRASPASRGPLQLQASSAWTCLPPMTAGCMLTFNSSAGQSPERRGTRCRMLCPIDDVANARAGSQSRGPHTRGQGDLPLGVPHLAPHKAQAPVAHRTHFRRHHDAGNRPSRVSYVAASRDQLSARQRQCSNGP